MNPSRLELISVLISVLIFILVLIVLILIFVLIVLVLVVILVSVLVLVLVLVLIVHFFPPKARFKFNLSTLLRSILLCKISFRIIQFFKKYFFILYAKSFQ